jgi:ABC-type antimicrobial peptide transport system permease subunit
MDQVAAQSIARTRFSMLMMTIFACLSVLLAATGLYGLMAFSVKQRVQEIGIRMALGAGARHIRGMLLLEGMRLALMGISIGVASAFALARLLTSALFGVTPQDPFAFAAVPALLVAVAVIAVWMPTRRATRVDPLVALRAE